MKSGTRTVKLRDWRSLSSPGRQLPWDGGRGGKNAESGWEVICDERASGELMESSGNSGAKYKARNYGREELADASWLGYC